MVISTHQHLDLSFQQIRSPKREEFVSKLNQSRVKMQDLQRVYRVLPIYDLGIHVSISDVFFYKNEFKPQQRLLFCHP